MGRKANPVAHENAAALFKAVRPEWALDPVMLARAVDRLWDCTGRTYAEFAISHRLIHQGRAAFDDVGHLDRVLGAGRPVIVLFLHTGNWEVSFMQLAYHAPGRGALIFDPPKQTARAAIAFKVRRQAPFDLFPMGRMVWRRALAHLQRPGGILITAADESIGGQIGAPFFGRPVRTDGNLGKVARLALRTGAVVLPFCNQRHPGPRFTSHVLPSLDFSGSADDPSAVQAAVAMMDAAVTKPTFDLLDQWYMALMYRGHAERPAEL